MAKSKIIKEMANEEVSLQVSLKRALIIASDIGNESFKKWIQKELSGYSENDKLPPYRIFKGVYKASYFMMGMQRKDEPMSVSTLFGEGHEDLAIYNCYDNIAFLEDACKDERLRKVDRICFRKYLRKSVDSFFLEISQNQFSNAIAKVTEELLTVLLKIDSELGNLDSLDVCLENEEKRTVVNEIINNYFGSVIKMGDNNEINKSEIVGGDKDGE